MRSDEHGIGPLCDGNLERGFVVRNVTDIDSKKSDTAGPGNGVCARVGEALGSILRISRYHDQQGTWQRLCEYLESFADYLRKIERHPRDVAARTSEARHDTGTDRIAHEAEYDWNGGRRLLGRQGSRRTHCNDHVNFEANQLLGKSR